MTDRFKAPKLYWVSSCCLAPTSTHRPRASMYSDTPPDPVVTCDCCEQRCEEWGLTKEEYREELLKAGKDPDLYINDEEEDGESEVAPSTHPKKD